MKTARSAKRGLALLLCLLMFASLLPAAAFAELPAPSLVSAVVSGTDVVFTWQEVYGAEQYRVYRHTPNASWSYLATVPSGTTSYTDSTTSVDVTYTYSVRCVNAADTAFTSGYDAKGVSCIRKSTPDLDTPQLISADPDGPALLVSWYAVAGAAGYRIWRREPGKSWSYLADLPGTSYRDTSAKAGVTYTYSVRCVNAAGELVSGYNASGVSGSWNKESAGWLATPKLISAKGQKDGILFKWENVTGNAGYNVYRHEPDKSWQFVASVGANVVEYLDTLAPTGVTVTYSVYAINAMGDRISDYNGSGVSGSWKSSTIYSLDTPVLIGATEKDGGVLFRWTGVTGAEAYRVFRRIGSGSWSALGDVTAPTTSYQDNSVSAGVNYIYSVRCINLAGTTYLSGYDAKGVAVTSSEYMLIPPTLDVPTTTETTVELSWSLVPGADYYIVYRKDADGVTELGSLPDPTNTYSDITAASGVKYTYFVRCADASFDPASGSSNEQSLTFYQAPVMKSAVPDANGLKITWEAVNGAPGYLVYRNGVKIHTTPIQGTSATDKTANANTLYTYKVVVCSADGKQELSKQSNPGVDGYYTGKAAIKKLERDRDDTYGNFLHLEWDDVPGVDHYKLYRKMNDGEWIVIAEPMGGTVDYDDFMIVNGDTYAYYIRGYDAADEPLGTYDPVGKSIVYYAAPTLTKVENDGNAIRISWEQVGGIFTYRVFRKLNDASWQPLADVAALTYLDETIASETKYTYTVVCLDAAGNIVSARAKEVTITSLPFYQQPLLTGAVPAAYGVKVTWQGVNGVSNYLIYRKDDSKTSWGDPYDTVTITPGDPCEYIDAGALNGSKYSYTVACADGAWNRASDFNQTGLSTTYYMQPTLDKIYTAGYVEGSSDPNRNNIQFTWYPVDGISTYDIYRKSGSGSWLLLAANVKGTKYTDTTCQNAETYYYSVACTVAGVEVSSYDETGLRAQYFNAPTLVSVVNKDGFVELKFSGVDGCTDYNIYRKAANATWWTAYDTMHSADATVIYEDHGVTSNTKYTYSVRCIDSLGNLASGYDATGKTIVYLDVPVLPATVGTPKPRTLRFSWSSVPGATKYEVYMKTATTPWTRMGTYTGTTYTSNSNLTPGMEYTFSVRAKNDAGYTSWYDEVGVTGVPTA